MAGLSRICHLASKLIEAADPAGTAVVKELYTSLRLSFVAAVRFLAIAVLAFVVAVLIMLLVLRFVDPPMPGMGPEPCILCNEHAWDVWNLDPYSLHIDRKPMGEPFWYRYTPDRVGQLGLGLGNHCSPCPVVRP